MYTDFVPDGKCYYCGEEYAQYMKPMFDNDYAIAYMAGYQKYYPGRCIVVLKNHKEEINEMINKLKIELEELNLSDKTVLFYFKKNLSLLQIKLGIQNTFLLAAFELFLESYRNMCIKHIANKNYTLIKN